MKTSLPLRESKYFCVLPWLHLALFPEGSAKICCVAGSCVSSGGDPLSLQSDSLADVWNSQYVRDVRRAMLAGRPVADCSACYVAEKSGGTSHRMQHNTRWAAELGPLLDEILESSRLNDFAAQAPIYYQLMPGNLCNLKCRMCVPTFSSMIERDKVHSKWAPPLLEHIGRPAVDWTTDHVRLARKLLGVRHEGFHAIEDPAGQPFRWTTGRASVSVPLPADVRADTVRLRLRRSAASGRRLRVLINGTVAFQGKTPRWRGLDQTFHVSAGRREVTVEIEADPLNVKGESRELGVMLESLELNHSACPVEPAADVKRLPNGPWYRDDAWVRDVLLANAEQMRGLYFTGGEPMLEKQVEHVLDELIRRGAADNVSLELNTNCTVLREPVFSKMLQFKHLTLGLSIDGYGSCYEYIRFPARWETIRRNVDRLASMAGERLRLVATVVLQVYNALDVVRLLEFLDERDVGFNILVATMPLFLRIGILPASVRTLAAARLRDYAETRCRPHNRAQVLAIVHRIEHVKDECSPETLRTLMLFSNDLDATRGQSMRAVNGELLELLAKEGFHWTDELSLAKPA